MSRESSPNILLTGAIEDFSDLDKELNQLENDHKKYCEILTELNSAQKKCLSQIAHQRYRIKCIGDVLNRAARGQHGEEERHQMVELKEKIIDRKLQLREMEDNLPHKNGIYLKIILGSVNISLLTKEAKFIYKKDYEKFKLTVSYIILALAFLTAFVFIKTRWCDLALNFLMVWYYCTLTIRESILIVNGSRIKGWWLTHHFISTVLSGISLIWPDGYTYAEFRMQHITFIMYTSFVYVLQYYYQSGCLYRLRSLGQSHEMDITVEGFMSWMWKGLSFILPFLFFGYFFQLYNAYVLWQLSSHPLCTEWQVGVIGLIHFFLFVGNIATTTMVVMNKLKEDGFQISYLRKKYNFVNNFLSQGHGHAD